MICPMRILRATIAASLGLALTSVSFARIGETQEECADRYGEPTGKQAARLTKSDPEADVFNFSGIKVVVEYRAGEAWAVTYTDRKMNQTNAEKILANYAADGGCKWEGPTTFSVVKHWNDVKGGQHAALYASPQFSLVVLSKAAVDGKYNPVVFISEQVEEEAVADDSADEGEEKSEEPKPAKKDPFDGF